MELNKLQAAKATGKSRTTLDRHIRNGKLSSRKNGQGKVVIDVAELERAYGKVDIDTLSSTVPTEQNDTPAQNNSVQREIEIREEKIEALQAQLNREQQQAKEMIEDLRSDRDHWREQAKAATLLLTYDRKQQEKPDHQKPKNEASGLWNKIRSLTAREP